jgi:MATE family multidrug resistance protein
LLINIPVNYAFIYGRWGAPEMGAAGCGIASSIVMWLQLLALLVVIQKLPQLKAIALFKQWQAPRWPIIASQLNLGLPVGLSITAEVALFSSVALIIAPLGAAVVAGHQVALSISSLTFMLPLSLGIAITIHTGQYLGAGQHHFARYATRVGVLGGALLSIMNLLFIILGRDLITSLYTDDPAIYQVAFSLLLFAAIFQLPDAIQVCAASALRAYMDTRIPMFITLFCYWLVSIPLGWGLTHGFGDFPAMGAEGMWVGLVSGLSLAAVLQSWRLWWVVKHKYIGV